MLAVVAEMLIPFAPSFILRFDIVPLSTLVIIVIDIGTLFGTKRINFHNFEID